MPRQNGKNGALEIRELFGMVMLGEAILHTAHEVKTARKAFKRLMYFFGQKVNDPAAKFPELNALVTELRQTNGQEAIFLSNGGSIEFIARSKGSGRGFTVDVLVCDEAQELSDEALEALMPTISAAPRGNPQIIFTGTPPGPTMNGEAFARMRTNALKPNANKVCWKEWSVPRPEPGQPALNIDSKDVWAQGNPGLGMRLLLDVVEGEREQFSDEGFMRERLGMWDAEAVNAGFLDIAGWRRLVDPEPGNAPKRLEAFAVEVNLDRSISSIGAAGVRDDGRVHVEFLERARGTGWVVDRCASLKKNHGPVKFVVDSGGPAADLIPALEAAGLQVVTATTRDVMAACAALVDAVNDGTLAHGPQPELDDAVAGARRRSIGDGGFAFGRKASNVDITPLVAVTLAHWIAGGAGGPIYARVAFASDSMPTQEAEEGPKFRILTSEQTTTLRVPPPTRR